MQWKANQHWLKLLSKFISESLNKRKHGPWQCAQTQEETATQNDAFLCV